jgi:hypothetical protein
MQLHCEIKKIVKSKTFFKKCKETIVKFKLGWSILFVLCTEGLTEYENNFEFLCCHIFTVDVIIVGQFCEKKCMKHC